MIQPMLVGVPEETRKKMVNDNIQRYYNLEFPRIIEKHKPLNNIQVHKSKKTK